MSFGHIVVGGGHMASQVGPAIGQALQNSHIIPGAGHFIEQGGRLVQEFANHVQVGGRIMEEASKASGAFSNITNDVTNFFESGKVFFDNPKDWKPLKIGNDLDSRAWDDRNGHFDRNGGNFFDKASEAARDFKDSHAYESIKEGLLSAGCFASGDHAGAVEHGYNSLYEKQLDNIEIFDKIAELWDKRYPNSTLGNIPSKPVFPDSMYFRGTWNDNAAAIPEWGTWQNDTR